MALLRQGAAPHMSLLDTARTVFLLARKGSSLELQQHLLKLRDEARALEDENRKLKARLAELERRAEGHENHHFDGTVFWGSKDSPGRDE